MVNKNLVKHYQVKVPATTENGVKWYQWLFTEAPDLRKFFVGAENIDTNGVAQSERFQKQGLRFLKQMERFVDLSDNPEELDKELKPFCEKHRRYKVTDPALYEVAGGIWLGFLKSQSALSAEEETEWLKMWGCFVEKVKQNFS